MTRQTSKYTDGELAELATLDETDLTPGEKVALKRWHTRLIRENRPIPDAVEDDKRSATQVADVSVSPEQALQTAQELVWYGEQWPQGAELPLAAGGGKYVREARALREFAGRVARIDKGLTRSQAIKVRLRVVKGEFVAFKPRGTYAARLLREDGSYSVLVKYVGGAK
ncbi:hypothetical protein WM014_00160 [Bifidobacterium mongoliense]|jgi:hypothetical protein|uniref:hypothetical protein n=1 Tax=Bifidobacterium mongoliense TaxID=518643 RepID=UPI0030ED19BD